MIDEQAAGDAENSYAENQRRLRSELTMDGGGQLPRLVVTDSKYTYFYTSIEMEGELINYHHEVGHDLGLPIAWHTLCQEDVEMKRTCRVYEQATRRSRDVTEEDVITVRKWY